MPRTRTKATTKKRSTRRAPARSSRAADGRRKSTRSTSRKPEITATNLQTADRRFISRYAAHLSPTTKRAKWTYSADDGQDRNGQALATRSHEVIMHWAEERGAVPATVPGTEHGKHLGVMRFDFPGYGGGSLQKVSWEDWFRTFDARKLVFLYQEFKKDGSPSNFFKLDNPTREHS